MEAHPNDVLLAKPAKIAETEKQLDRTNSRPDMPGRPISSASQTPYPLAQAVLHRSSLPTQDNSASRLKLTEHSPRFRLHLRSWYRVVLIRGGRRFHNVAGTRVFQEADC